MRQLKTFACGLELCLWALWLGALWMLALWVAPSLFKWLPRPEAGLVAARLFYMMSWGSGLFVVLLPLLAVVNRGPGLTVKQVGQSLPAEPSPSLQKFLMEYRWALFALLVVFAVVLTELCYMHPHMRDLRQAMAEAGPELVPVLKAEFAQMHVYSTTVYAIKMVAVLVWGLLRYITKKTV